MPGQETNCSFSENVSFCQLCEQSESAYNVRKFVGVKSLVGQKDKYLLVAWNHGCAVTSSAFVEW